jgi:hypothetical protein
LNVTVAEVLAGAEVRVVPLSAECAGYLVLAAADQIGGAPRRVEANDVLLSEDGVIRVISSRAADASEAERDLRAVLDALLLRSSAPTGGLLRASRRAPGAGIEALVRELETALIPVNRAAAKRALARLERETARALQSGRIKPASLAPPAPERSAPPVPASVAPAVVVSPVPSAPEPPVVVVAAEPSPPPPTVVPEPLSGPPPVALAESALPSPHEPVAAAIAALALEVADGESFEPRDQTLAMPRVAPRGEPEAEMVETRPEPVVLRASQRPPAPPSVEVIAAEPVRTEPLPKVTPIVQEPLPFVSPSAPLVDVAESPSAPFVAVASELPPAVTPVLGTRMSETTMPATPQASADEDEFEIVEVIFGQDELTVIPEDAELIYSQGSDWTEPCPPLAVESILPPPSSVLPPPVVAVSSAESAPQPAVELHFSAVPEAVAELAPVAEPSIDLAVLVESRLPPWVTANVDAEDVTPPPRVALPEPRPSDVNDLLLRMGEAPMAVDELRSGLKRLAGMEPTPPPPHLRVGTGD